MAWLSRANRQPKFRTLILSVSLLEAQLVAWLSTGQACIIPVAAPILWLSLWSAMCADAPNMFHALANM